MMATCQLLIGLHVSPLRQLMTDVLTWSLFKTTRTNVVTFQTLGKKKIKFPNPRTNGVFNPYY
jgi:hypothetical protein